MESPDLLLSPYVTLNSKNNTDPNAVYHDFRVSSNDLRPDWYFEQMTVMRWTNRVGWLGYTPQESSNMASSQKTVGIYDGIIYGLSDYIQFPPVLQAPTGMAPPQADTAFTDPSVVNVLQFNSGTDVTKKINALPLSRDVWLRQRACLRNLFAIGQVDNRNSVQCQFATYILLALSIMMVSIIAFKFLPSINFGSAGAPENHNKFVICQVPCYTEGEQSLKKTIDSLANTKYDDKRKLLFIICDGMIVGSGNDRPTPRIVLDILGLNYLCTKSCVALKSLSKK